MEVIAVVEDLQAKYADMSGKYDHINAQYTGCLQLQHDTLDKLKNALEAADGESSKACDLEEELRAERSRRKLLQDHSREVANQLEDLKVRCRIEIDALNVSNFGVTSRLEDNPNPNPKSNPNPNPVWGHVA